MERYYKAHDLLDLFERGLNPLPEVKPDTPLLVRLARANSRLLEAYCKLYGIRVERQELRLFADGSDQVYVITWPGPLFREHWAQRLGVTAGLRRRV